MGDDQKELAHVIGSFPHPSSSSHKPPKGPREARIERVLMPEPGTQGGIDGPYKMEQPADKTPIYLLASSC